jgi:hypothetical protein
LFAEQKQRLTNVFVVEGKEKVIPWLMGGVAEEVTTTRAQKQGGRKFLNSTYNNCCPGEDPPQFTIGSSQLRPW